MHYSGPLTHEGRPKNSENEIWLGIEWDDPKRGIHNGTVKDTFYFQTSENLKAGSLLRLEKANLGINVVDGIFKKYFKDNISDEIKTQIIGMSKVF